MNPVIHRNFKHPVDAKSLRRPDMGWLNAARRALGLSLQRLGKLTGHSAQSVKDAERRELDGSISIGRLRDIGAAMDMELVYGFVPKGGSVEDLLYERALVYAKLIRERSHQTMVLENQLPYGIDDSQKTAKLAERIVAEKPMALWD